jgi:hypothetical protein
MALPDNFLLGMCALMSSNGAEKGPRLAVRKDACSLPEAGFKRIEG